MYFPLVCCNSLQGSLAPSDWLIYTINSSAKNAFFLSLAFHFPTCLPFVFLPSRPVNIVYNVSDWFTFLFSFVGRAEFGASRSNISFFRCQCFGHWAKDCRATWPVYQSANRTGFPYSSCANLSGFPGGLTDRSNAKWRFIGAPSHILSIIRDGYKIPFFFCFGFFLYFDEFLFCYILQFLHTDPYEQVGKIPKKEEKTKHIYIANSHTITYWYKKKERNTPQYLLLYLQEKINNKWSKRRKDPFRTLSSRDFSQEQQVFFNTFSLCWGCIFGVTSI